jgi:hypothetical protein
MDWWMIGLMGQRAVRFPNYPLIHLSNHPFFVFVCGGAAKGNKKPTAVASRGFC